MPETGAEIFGKILTKMVYFDSKKLQKSVVIIFYHSNVCYSVRGRRNCSFVYYSLTSRASTFSDYHLKYVSEDTNS